MKKQPPINADAVKLLNPERKPLTTEKLRELSGLELSDEQAEEMVFSIHLFAKLLYQYVRKKESIIIDNQYVVNLFAGKQKAA